MAVPHIAVTVGANHSGGIQDYDVSGVNPSAYVYCIAVLIRFWSSGVYSASLELLDGSLNTIDTVEAFYAQDGPTGYHTVSAWEFEVDPDLGSLRHDGLYQAGGVNGPYMYTFWFTEIPENAGSLVDVIVGEDFSRYTAGLEMFPGHDGADIDMDAGIFAGEGVTGCHAIYWTASSDLGAPSAAEQNQVPAEWQHVSGVTNAIEDGAWYSWAVNGYYEEDPTSGARLVGATIIPEDSWQILGVSVFPVFAAPAEPTNGPAISAYQFRDRRAEFKELPYQVTAGMFERELE